MAANALVQTRIDAGIKERATAVLSDIGLTVSDVVRIVLTRTANEGEVPFSLTDNTSEHDAWFRARVREALDDRKPGISHDKVEAHFARRRSAALRKAEKVKA
ncbi:MULTISPECIES: type II toxin-antitoxin system RelB/DinJ family antitoxin [Acidobacteriaceae]|uniref:type II toxin-antitoxin system RelB/DinJ family antitoxin n=1 Tax=Acidobacteriaceae TaxID=204434 RepID=UPI00131CB9B8|nr:MULTISPECIES: type II toxin-antitoxin system RelB/DinJ family antitoxin [Acidobacteriaceae]MDW5267972.1 type II toxin-antitoxin system RelB/DinJ family antitoxin [Edaphobacter sp.]